MSRALPRVVLGEANDHGCLWCKAHDCPDRWNHERLWGSTDTYYRLSTAERVACPLEGCGEPVNNGMPCVARVPAASVPVRSRVGSAA